MIRLKCPQCGQTAEAPEGIVAHGLQCYQCNVPVIIADPVVAARRVRASQSQVHGMILGACLGAVAVPLLGIGGGTVGMAIAGGIAGTIIGITIGLVQSIFDPLWLGFLLWPQSVLSTWVIACIVLGFLGGVYGAISGDLVKQFGEGAVLFWSGVGGLCWGGWLGAYLGKTSAESASSGNSSA